MNDDEFIAERIAALEESVRYFAIDNKPERERWVVKALLEAMNILYESCDVTSSDQDPPDVTAFDGHFEVKEILDHGRKRHQEYKQELERAKTVTDPQELLKGFTPVDTSVAELFERCVAETEKLNHKYPHGVRRSLDLLFYVNLRHVFTVHEQPFPDLARLNKCGWRSVSFVRGQVGCCFYAASHAPAWMRERVGTVQRKLWN